MYYRKQFKEPNTTQDGNLTTYNFLMKEQDKMSKQFDEYTIVNLQASQFSTQLAIF